MKTNQCKKKAEQKQLNRSQHWPNGKIGNFFACMHFKIFRDSEEKEQINSTQMTSAAKEKYSQINTHSHRKIPVRAEIFSEDKRNQKDFKQKTK